MKILVVNAGSSSLKYQLFDMDGEKVLAKGQVERIGIKEDKDKGTQGGHLKQTVGGKVIDKNEYVANHVQATEMMLSALQDPENGAIKSTSEIGAVGHRVLHGGKKFSASVVINEEVKEAIRECIPLGPLHNPANLMGIEACEKVMPGTPQVAVFDTAFHMTMPPKAYRYAIPKEYYENDDIRRYGFHGTSHRYVSKRVCEFLGVNPVGKRVIVCHLGNGSSLSAVVDGKCVDTSMGLTPLEGVPMGTRCGDMDPAIVTYLMERLNLDKKGIDNYLNKKSGVLGISGVSSDFRDLEEAANNGNERAQLALDTFCYKVKKYIGAYAAALGGVDAIVFTAGVGENDRGVREKVLSGLEYLGVDVDFDFNNSCPRGEEVEISKPTSRVKVFVIPTDEEMMIARDTAALTAK